MAERPVRIITKRTAVPGKIPTGTTGTELNLIKAGELASNLADKKLFSYDGSNIFEFGSKSFLGLTGGTVSGETTFQSGITANTISVVDPNTNFIIVGNTFGQTSLISPSGAIVLTPGYGGVQINGANPDLKVNGNTIIDGNLGVGTPSPMYKLDVNGNGRFSGGLTANTFSATSIDKVDYIVFNTGTTSATTSVGAIYFDNAEKALSYNTSINQGVTVNLGQQNYIRVFNNTGIDIPRGRALEVLSAYSGLPSVTLAINKNIGFNIIGVSAEIIPNNSEGIAITNGIISDIELTGMTVGSLIYASDSVPGKLDDATKYLSFPLTARTNQVGYVVKTGATTGKLFVEINNENSVLSLTDLERNVLEGNTISTGAFEFTGMTSASTTTFNVAPLKGWLVNNTYANALSPDAQSITYTGGTNISITNIASADGTYVLINSASTLIQQTTFPTPQQRRENIYIGKVVHPNRSTILSINNTVDHDVSPMSSLRDLWTPLKLVNQGVLVSPNGANLNINTSYGTLWGNGIGWTTNQLNPNSVNVAAKTQASFFYRTQTGGTNSAVTVIDPTKYDVGGVITSMGNANVDNASNQRVYLYPTGVINILYGQTNYANLTAAVAGIQTESFTTYPNAADNGVLIGIISVRNDIVADGQPLTNTSYAVFTSVSKFGELLGGTGGLSTTTLQQAYDNSTNPEITTNSTLNGVQFRGGTGSDLDPNIVIENNAGVVTGQWLANGELFATAISATTYYNLPTDVYITGGTYDNSNGTAIFGNSTGGTFNVNGFTTGDTYWTSGSVGSFSVKIDNNSGLDATGDRAVASGNNTLASGNDSFAQNGNTIAFGNYSHAEGYQTKAVGLGSHSEGGFTLAGWKGFSASSVVSGLITISNNVDYTSEFTGSTVLLDSKFYAYNSINYSAPNFTIQLDDTSINAGISVADASNLNSSLATTFNGLYSHAEGRYTTALGNESHAEGSYTTAAGEHSRSEGLSTVALGIASHAQGGATTAIGDYSHSEGIGSIAFGSTSHAEGGATTAIGDYSHSEGGATTAYGAFSHASGSGSTASGITSFVHSSNSFAIGDRSVVLGGKNITGITNDTVYVSNFNIYNTPTTDNSLTKLLVRKSNGDISVRDYNSVNYTPNLVTVALNGGSADFTSIKAAVDSITGATSANTYVVKVGPGQFIEDEIDLTNTPYVSIVGSSIQGTQILPNTNSQHIIKIGVNNEVSFLTLSGAPSGYAGIYCYDVGDFAQVHKLSFYDCDTNILVESNTKDTQFYGEYLDYNGKYTYGTKVIANNNYLALANLENYYNYPNGNNITYCNYATGSGATFNVFVGDNQSNGVSGTTAFYIQDGAELNASTITLDGFTYGIRNPNIGNPIRFDVDNASIVNGEWDLRVERNGTFGTFGGSSNHKKIYTISSDVYWSFLDIEDGELDITRKASVTFADGTHTDFTTLLFEGSTMGLMDGGEITTVSGFTVSATAGYGYLAKTLTPDVHKRIDWNNSQITLGANENNYIFINENEILSDSGTRPNSIYNIILGRVVTDSTGVSFIDLSPANSDHASNRFGNLFRNALGPIYASGSIVTENATPFKIDVTAGEYYYSTSGYMPTGGTQVTFDQYYRDGVGGWVVSATTLVNNTSYDVNGSLSSLTSGYYTKHTLYVVGDDSYEKYFLVLGQNQYSTLVQAESALLPTPPSFFTDSVAQIANIYIEQGASGITQFEDIKPSIGFKAGGVNATSIHANLLGLGADDHTQYLLVDGSRAMSGNLDIGSNNITNVNTINGVDISTHAIRHQFGGADAVGTVTPSANAIPYANVSGKLDEWISSATTTTRGLVKMSVAPAITGNPIAIGDNDIRVSKAITGVTYLSNTFTFTNNNSETLNVGFNTLTGLTVNGNTTITNGLVRIQGSSSNELVRITQLGSGNAFVVEDSTNPDTSPFVIDSSGFVGIGVETPTNPLHISGSTDQIKLSNGSSVWTVASKSNGDFVAVASGTRASMYFGSYGTTNSTRIGSNGAIIVNSPSDSLFTGNGSVGIGISAPETKLHVSGNTIISGILSGGTMVITTTPASSTSTQILMRNSTSGQIEIADSTTPGIYNFGMTYAMSNFNFLT